jgi:hypothetical protein
MIAPTSVLLQEVLAWVRSEEILRSRGSAIRMSAEPPIPTLNYASATPRKQKSRLPSGLRGLPLVVGFQIAWLSGSHRSGIAELGVLSMLCGFLWYAAARIRTRTRMSKFMRFQLLCATIVCFIGMLAIMEIDDKSDVWSGFARCTIPRSHRACWRFVVWWGAIHSSGPTPCSFSSILE